MANENSSNTLSEKTSSESGKIREETKQDELNAAQKGIEEENKLRENISGIIEAEIFERQLKLEEWERRLEEKEAELAKKEIDLIGAVERKSDERTAMLRNELDRRMREVAEQEADIEIQKIDLKHSKQKLDKTINSMGTLIENEVTIHYDELLQENKTLHGKLDALSKKQRELLDILQEYMAAKEENTFEENKKLKAALRSYKIIGTPEEFEQLKKKSSLYKEIADDNIALTGLLQQARNNSAAIDGVRGMNEILEKQNEELRNRIMELQAESAHGKTVSRDDMLSAFSRTPSVLLRSEKISEIKRNEGELDWLRNIREKTKEEGISYTERHWTAFHTCLKINEWSPLTILAGVSGTGKSEMPKRYAKHGGMNFVSVPVKPEWDSPSALFGYYNTLENRFEASELSRILYCMQKDNYKDRMLLVLLDEMNLAHPEQYFADLLSKYEEVRGNRNENAFIELPLGSGEPAEILEIKRNIIWTGTMNEDETTKGLSDKVIDRSSLITFPNPEDLLSEKGSVETEMNRILPFSVWDGWKNTAPTDPVELEQLIDEKRMHVNKINVEMRNMGRNIGHRVWRSMQQYIRNYPYVMAASSRGQTGKDLKYYVDIAFCDAVVFKLMPKLRGIETDEEKNIKSLNAISDILKDCAEELVSDFSMAKTNANGIFRWQSGNFLNNNIK